METTDHIFERLKVCVLVPTFNNAKTLGPLLRNLEQFHPHIIVVNDGSTDETDKLLREFPNITDPDLFPEPGERICPAAGIQMAREQDFEYAISIDSDGQHFAKDLTCFLEKLDDVPGALIIGARNMEQSSVPAKSSFGHRFSNFWFRFETGVSLPDTQSGYRCYPIARLHNMFYFTNRFEFEIEVIVRASWRGIPVVSVPVGVYYPPPEERVSHFRPIIDFTESACSIPFWY